MSNDTERWDPLASSHWLERRQGRAEMRAGAEAIMAILDEEPGPWLHQELVQRVAQRANVSPGRANQAIWSELAGGCLRFCRDGAHLRNVTVSEPEEGDDGMR